VKFLRPTHPGTSTDLARKGGRCRRGWRLRVGVPHGHYKTVTLVTSSSRAPTLFVRWPPRVGPTLAFVAGLRLSGLAAAKVYDRPINAALFEEWVEKCLVPTLAPAISSSWTTCRATKGRGSRNSSKPPVPSCAIFLPTART